MQARQPNNFKVGLSVSLLAFLSYLVPQGCQEVTVALLVTGRGQISHSHALSSGKYRFCINLPANFH